MVPLDRALAQYAAICTQASIRHATKHKNIGSFGVVFVSAAHCHAAAAVCGFKQRLKGPVICIVAGSGPKRGHVATKDGLRKMFTICLNALQSFVVEGNSTVSIVVIERRQ